MRPRGMPLRRTHARVIAIACSSAVTVLAQPRVLEIGGGSAGAMRQFLSIRPKATAVALELSWTSLRNTADAGEKRLQGVAGTALNLPFARDSFDAVIAFEVIEHLPDVARALDEALRVLRRPGDIIIGLPNHASLWTPVEDAIGRRSRLAFGVDHGRGAWRWWGRNAALPGANASREARSSCIDSRFSTRCRAATSTRSTTRRPLICYASSGAAARGWSRPAHS